MSEDTKSISEVGAAALVARLSEHAKYLSLDPLVGGVSANTYLLRAVAASGQEQCWVLREHGTNHSGHPATLEFALLKALHRAGLQVPEPLLCDVSLTISAYPLIVMTFVRGSSLIPLNMQQAYIDRMARQLWQIHRQPLEDLPALPQRLDPLPEAFDYLPREPQWRELRQRMRGLGDTAYVGASRLLHGDFWPQNLIWRQGEIVSVLDWEDAAVGDPHADVAAASVELRYLFGATGAQRFVSAYAELNFVDPFRLALWQVYVAAAAQHFMGQWGLEPARESHMRSGALAAIEAAAKVLRDYN